MRVTVTPRVLSAIFLSALIVVAANINASLVSAAESQPTAGLTISPSLKEITLSSGLLQAKTTVTLTNKTGRDLTGNIRLVDFAALNEAGGVSFGEAGIPLSKYGLANWMVLPGGNKVTLPNGQATTIILNVDNRTDLTPGGHYGALVVSTNNPDAAPSANKVGFKQELVSLLFVKKLGGEKYGLELESLSTGEKNTSPNSVQLRFKSTGNVQVTPRGYVTVTDPGGKIISKGIINPDSTLVLPESSRTFTTLMQSTGSSSKNGKYTITAYYRYDEQSQFRTKSIYVNRNPLLLETVFVVIALVVLGLVIGRIIYGVRRGRRRT